MSENKKLAARSKIRSMLPQNPAAVTLVFEDGGVSSSSFKKIKTDMTQNYSSVMCVFSPKRSAMLKYMKECSQYHASFVESLATLSKNKIILVCLRDTSELSAVISAFSSVEEFSFLNAGDIVTEDLYLDEGLTGTRPTSYTKALEKFGPLGLEKGIVLVKKPILLARAGSVIDRVVEGILKFLDLLAKVKSYGLKGIVYQSGSVISKEVISCFSALNIRSKFETNLRVLGPATEMTPVVSHTKSMNGLHKHIIIINRITAMINTKNKS